jgi:hypothetical protein
MAGVVATRRFALGASHLAPAGSGSLSFHTRASMEILSCAWRLTIGIVIDARPLFSGQRLQENLTGIADRTQA